MKTLQMQKARKLTYFAILTALVVVLQFTASAIKIGAVTLNFVLVPVIVCGILLGVFYGALLGFIVGVIILLAGVIGMDGFTNVLFAEYPVAITLVCVLKTTLAGAVSALVFNAAGKKHRYLGTFLSAVSAPVVNTGTFVVSMLFLQNALLEKGFIDGGKNAFISICIGLVGINFVFELLLNVVFAPAVYRVITIIDKKAVSDGEDGSAAESGAGVETESGADNDGENV